MKKLVYVLLAVSSLVYLSSSCNKDKHVPPAMSFISGTGLVSKDSSIAKNTQITFSVKVDKKEDDLNTLNVSYQYDSTNTSTTKDNFNLSSSEQGGFTKNYNVTLRNQVGKEKWIFTCTDKDGNVSTLSAIITVK